MSDKCSQCGGTGKCPDCKGTGFVHMRACVYCDPPGQCPRCHGKRFEAAVSSTAVSPVNRPAESLKIALRHRNQDLLAAIRSELGAAMQDATKLPGSGRATSIARPHVKGNEAADCIHCDGGEIDCIQCYGSGKHGANPDEPCQYCDGSGRQSCPDCGGTGKAE